MKNYILAKQIQINPREHIISSLLQSPELQNTSLILLSTECYANLINTTQYLEGIGEFAPYKNFVDCDVKNNTRTYVSLTPLYSANCYLLEEVDSQETKYKLQADNIQNVIYFFMEGEFENIQKTNINVFTFYHPKNESPINFIFDNFDNYKNCMFFLSQNSYNELQRNSTQVSAHKNMLRLYWKADDSYDGGQIMLHAAASRNLYFIENTTFLLSKQDISIVGIPKAIYFIS